MRKTIYPLFAILLLAGTVFAASLKPYAFPFIGRWQPSEDPVLIEDYGFQDIQNLRKDGKRLKGVSGHTKINTSVWDASYVYPENGFHFVKAQPSESHVIISARDASGANPTLYQNTTAIPDQGAFSGTVLYTADTSASLGRMSLAPKGNMVYTNGEKTLIWGGDEIPVTSFIVSDTSPSNTITNPKDFSDEVSNTRQVAGEVALITDGLDASTALSIHFEGADASTTFTDSSDSGHTPTANGDAQIDTDYKKFGSGSGLFDGTGDYVTYPDHANWFMGTDPFSVDFWANPSGFGLTDGFFGQYVDATHYAYLYYSDSTERFLFGINDGGTTVTVTSDIVSFALGTWYHIAVIRGWGGNANDWAICLNGTAIGTATDADPWPDFATTFNVGLSSTNYFNGHIDEFRVSKGVARWQSDFSDNLPVGPYKNIGRFWLVGATRPIQGVKYYVNKANTITSTMTGQEWNGSSWSDLTITDGTADGSVSLGVTGSVTFSTTEATAKTAVYQGLSLFWYQFNLSAGEAEIYYCTVDAPIQTIKNIWSIDPTTCNSFNVYHGSTWKDYTLEINSESSAEYSTESFDADLNAQTNAEYVYASFLRQLAAINIKMTSSVNTNAATVSVYYHDGSSWVSVGTVVDTTAAGGVALAKSGYISWNPPAREEEFTQNLFGLSGQPGAGFGDMDEFYYKIVWSATLSATVGVDLVSGVPATYPVKGYDLPIMFQNRLFLFSENARVKNIGIYSAYGNPDTFNGKDSGELYFGENTEIVAVAPLYNLYRTLGVEQLIIAKENALYRLAGGGPQTWEQYRMEGNIGCVAPLSMVTCGATKSSDDSLRNVVIFQSDSGVHSTDGAIINLISKDIACYWDANDSRAIPTDRLDDSVGDYDSSLNKYTLLISSGVGQTTHNVELEYSLDNREWTKLYRENGSGANPLQVAFTVRNTVGKSYTFGATNEGYMYRLENGKTWDSTAITQFVQTKDIMLDGEQPLFKHTNIDYLRLLFTDKATGATEDIDIIHYCDQTATTHGTNDQFVPTDIDMADGPYETRECTLGPCLYHSFKFTAITSTVSDGMELTGLGLYYDSIKTIME